MLMAAVTFICKINIIQSEEANMNYSNTQDLIALDSFAVLAAKKYSCKFTIEQVNGTMNRYRPVKIQADAVTDLEADSVRGLVSQLNERVDGFRFVQNEKNPQVVHIIEDRLSEVESYAIDQRISIEFSGTPDRLLFALGEILPNAKPRTGGDIKQVYGDNVTKVKSNSKDQKVRDILTDCSSWKEERPIIWRAETALDTQATVMEYHGFVDW